MSELQSRLDEMTAELLDRYEELTLLYELDLTSVFDVREICELALDRAARAIDVDAGLVAVADEGLVEIGAARGDAAVDVVGITSHVAATARELVLHEGDAPPTGVGVLSGPLLALPLLPPGGEGSIGALALARSSGGAPFTSGDAKLASAVARQLAAAVYRSRLVDSLRAAEAVRREVEIAAGIQRSLLPERPPEVAGATLAALCVPAANVGGDYYDLLRDGDGSISLVIADVAGHSVGSALMMAMARSVLRRELAAGESPAAVLRETNAALFDDLVRAELFITAFCARYEPSTGTLTYANAGHNPPLHRSGGDLHELDADGVALGILRDASFDERSALLAAGDSVLLYTDGVTEAAAPGGEQFGEERLHSLVREGALVDEVYAAVRTHTGMLAPGDDVTLVALGKGAS